jgi:hypothetical protein
VRKSSPITLSFIGRVPDVRFKLAVSNPGLTYTHTGFPTDVTLGTLAMQSRLPGWVSAVSAANADTLSVGVGGVSVIYFHNGTNWQRTTGPATNRDGIIISAGVPIIIFKRSFNASSSYVTRDLPYSL